MLGGRLMLISCHQDEDQKWDLTETHKNNGFRIVEHFKGT